MQVIVNDQPFELPEPATVATLVELRQPRPPFAVEVNKQLVRRAHYDATPLNDGDRIEVVTLVGGG